MGNRRPARGGRACFTSLTCCSPVRATRAARICIGKQIDPRRAPPNLDEYPPRGFDRFLDLIREHDIREVVLTGANTDPLLYRPLARLLDDLRAELPAGTRLGLHSNGRLALARMDLVRRFDKLCLSIPSFDPVIYRAAMGVEGVPDVDAIMDQSGLPVKLSCLVTEINRVEVPEYLQRCHQLGVRRVVLRKRFGERRDWSELLPGRWEDPQEERFGSPVYDRAGRASDASGTLNGRKSARSTCSPAARSAWNTCWQANGRRLAGSSRPLRPAI